MATEQDIFNFAVSQNPNLKDKPFRNVVDFAYSVNPNLKNKVTQQGQDPYGRPIARQEQIREQYPSEKLFGPITEGLAQAGLGVGMAKKTTPIGIAASGLMGGALELGRQATQAIASEPGAPATSFEAVKRLGQAAFTSAGLEGVTRGLFNLGGKIFAKDALTPFQADLIVAAKEKGIELLPSDVLKNRSISRFETMLDNMPLSGTIMSKAALKKLNAYKAYLTSTLSKAGTTRDKEQVGEVIQSTLNKRSQLARDKVNALYAYANDLIDSRALTDAKELKKEAAAIIANETRGIPSMQNRSLIQSAQEILDKKVWNYEELNANRAKLGEMIDKEMLSNVQGYAYKATDTARKWTRLKSALETDIDTFFKDQPEEAQAALELAKGTAKKQIDTYRNKQILKLVNTAPEKIVDNVIKKNNVTGIELIKKAVGPNGFKPLKEKFMTDLIEISNLSTAEAGKSFEPSRIFTELSKYEDSTLKAIFNKNELAELDKIANLSISMKTAEQMAGNTSRTATTLIGVAGLGGAGYAAYNRHPVIGTIALLTSPAIAKIYLSKVGRRIVIEGLRADEKEGLKFATRLVGFGVMNKIITPEQAKVLNDQNKP